MKITSIPSSILFSMSRSRTRTQRTAAKERNRHVAANEHRDKVVVTDDGRIYAYQDSSSIEQPIEVGWPRHSQTARVMEILMLYHFPVLIRSLTEG